MKARAILLAIPVMLGVAFAQSQSGPTGEAKGNSAQPNATKGAAAGAVPELKTTGFRGTLVDLGCGGSAAASAQSTGAGSTAGGATAATGTANRAAGDASCPVTANSTQLGLKEEKTGQVVRFDLVGNQRAQDALKTNKNWSKNLTENKPIKVKINGVQQGDKLIVSSID
jgi:hypothetical protein